MRPALAEERLGRDRGAWSWGALHTYLFQTETSKMAPHLGFSRRPPCRLGPCFTVGPFPAPGDQSTLNVASYTIGRDFSTWLIPAMRMVLDFSLEEPLHIINSHRQSVQSRQPSLRRRHPRLLQGSYHPSPFGRAHRKAVLQGSGPRPFRNVSRAVRARVFLRACTIYDRDFLFSFPRFLR
jgi:acyl-homoserine-lactone acylase